MDELKAYDLLQHSIDHLIRDRLFSSKQPVLILSTDDAQAILILQKCRDGILLPETAEQDASDVA